ncbi:RDD domain protein [Neiella marina]|uniref:RDD domain protein n=2 Tax=Neiella marina TaxID=508461 RepID=A0A8J2U215_9GAMM|nr:RDD domain protein [Neiella marina]
MEQDSSQLGSDTRSKITPYAFRVAPQLLDIPLARPWRRGIAMLIDLIIIGGAAVLLDVAWALPIFILLWLIKQHLHGIGKRVALIAAFIFIPIAAVMLSDDEDIPTTHQVSDAISILSQTPSFIAINECDDTNCVKAEAVNLKQALAETSLDTDVQYQILAEILADTELTGAELAQLLDASSDTPPSAADKVSKPKVAAEETEIRVGGIGKIDDCEPEVTPMGLIRGAMKDLGIGFSWAIAYFTILPAWFNGQTVGKRLLRTRVVRLDGKILTAWGCFGRYGGYVAGLATGMLGFLQIYWDPNRQAIQDKIATTAVIYRKR